MKVSKYYIGKLVALTWRDPTLGRGALDKAPKGRAALSKWVEYGRVDDVTDGVVRLRHSEAITAPVQPGDEVDEIAYTAVDEGVIDDIMVLEPVPKGAQPKEEVTA